MLDASKYPRDARLHALKVIYPSLASPCACLAHLSPFLRRRSRPDFAWPPRRPPSPRASAPTSCLHSPDGHPCAFGLPAPCISTGILNPFIFNRCKGLVEGVEQELLLDTIARATLCVTRGSRADQCRYAVSFRLSADARL
jgi:hypothetical protein